MQRILICVSVLFIICAIYYVSVFNFQKEQTETKRAYVPTPPNDALRNRKIDSDIVWVNVPGGVFSMGARDDDKKVNALLSHSGQTITMASFELAKTEVTNAQYKKCVDAGVCTEPSLHGKLPVSFVYVERTPKVWKNLRCLARQQHGKPLPSMYYDTWGNGASFPVVCLTHQQASTYAEWVGGYLPSEAQWEYAARTVTNKIQMGGPHEVCSAQRGAQLCDMLGNVYEWTSDVFKGYVSTPDVPRILAGQMVIRGGGWMDEKYNFTLSALWRGSAYHDVPHYYIGFRPARGLQSVKVDSVASAFVPFSAKSKTVLFQPYKRKESWNLYRIPALLRTYLGSLLVAVEGRTYDHDYGETAIAYRRSIDDGVTWSKEVNVTSSLSKCVNTPLFVQAADGTIYLFFATTSIGVQNYDGAHLMFVKSIDDGASWSRPRASLANSKPGPGHGIRLTSGPSSGRLIVPARITGECGTSCGAFTLYSDDDGKTWHDGSRGHICGGENQMAEVGEGKLLSVHRPGKKCFKTRSGQLKEVQYSNDSGQTWGRATLSDTLLEPLAAASVISSFGHPDYEKDMLLYSAPLLAANQPHDHAARRNLVVRMSEDLGKTWPYALLCQDGQAGYSDLAWGSSGMVHMVFERGDHRWDEEIVYMQFHINDVKSAPINTDALRF